MQKKTMIRIAVAAALAIVIAIILLFGGHGSSASSLAVSAPNSTSQAESRAVSLAESGSGASSAESTSQSEREAVSEEQPDSEPEKPDVESRSEPASESASDSASGAAESKPASSAASSTASGAAHSAASSEAAASQPAASHPASAVPAASENEVDAQIKKYIKQMEELRTRSENHLYKYITESYDEYISYPEEKRSIALKVSIVLSKTAELNAAQSQCDKEFNALLAEMRQYLRDNGQDQTAADEAEKAYNDQKAAMSKELTNLVYNSAVGSGDGGTWIRNHVSS